jgi:hypothetical protein
MLFARLVKTACKRKEKQNRGKEKSKKIEKTRFANSNIQQ